MIGRAALGQPWLFARMRAAALGGPMPAEPSPEEKRRIIRQHIQALHQLYGEAQGLRVARKHIGWYCALLPDGDTLRRPLLLEEDATMQLALLDHYFDARAADAPLAHERAAA